MNVVQKYFGSSARQAPMQGSSFQARNHPMTKSPITQFSTKFPVIPCSFAWLSQKPAIHAAFLDAPKKFPVIFPVIGEFEQNGTDDAS